MLSTDIVDVTMTADGDLFVGPNGTTFISGSAGIAQLLLIAVRLFLNEWFLNLDAGVDWDSILGEKYNEQQIRDSLTPVILAVPSITTINSLTISLDDSTRAVGISYSVQSAFDDTPITATLVVS